MTFLSNLVIAKLPRQQIIEPLTYSDDQLNP